MIVIPPITVTPAMLTSSIAEPDTTAGEVEWNAATNYSAGTRVIRASLHKVYERVGTAGVDAGTPETTPSKWVEVGPTNRWAMFDLFTTTGSSYGSSLSLDIALTSRINSIALIGMSMEDVVVTITIGASEIYNSSHELVSRNVVNYYDFFFAEFEYQDALLLRNIPPVLDGVIHITSANSGSITSIVLGTSEYLGFTERGHKNNSLNFSLIEKDDFGNSLLIPRRSVPITSQVLVVKKRDVSRLLAIREALNATPAVWAGLEDSNEAYFKSLLILGIYKDFTLTLDYPEYAKCTLELEEL